MTGYWNAFARFKANKARRVTMPFDDARPMVPAQRIKDTDPHHIGQENPDRSNLFWMCYVEGERAPAMKHMTWPAAVREAERLSKASPDKKVYLLRTEQVLISKIETNAYTIP